MLKLFQEHIARQQLCKTTDKILLAVSGGIDSMIMLQLFYASQYKIGVAHCNFQLRGDESDADELFVKQKCAQLHIPFFSIRFDTNNYAVEHKISIQMAARDLRYEWFKNILKDNNFDLLATAHHLNDSIETIFLNLIHGRGIDGLTGIAVKNKSTIRPMLFASREDIEKYALAESITWREDSSNQTSDYARNKIRKEVIPVLKELNPGLELTIQRVIDKNNGATELLRLGVKTFESKFIIRTSGKTSIEKQAFDVLQYPSSVLYELLKEYQFSLDQCDSIINGLHGQTGKTFFSESHQLVIDRVNLIITKISQPQEEVLIAEGQNAAISGAQKLEMVETAIEMLNEQYRVALDTDKLKYPLVWRRWRDGDFFYPLGMDHKKKISDFLIDKKVARNDKEQITVLESAGEIVWVIGYQISNRFKITSATKRAIRFAISPHFI